MPPAGNYGAPRSSPAPAPAATEDSYSAQAAAAPSSNYGVPAADPIDGYGAPTAPSTGYGVPLSDPIASNSIADYSASSRSSRKFQHRRQGRSRGGGGHRGGWR